MAINAIFSADFSDFKRGVEQADQSLNTLKTATTTSTSAIGGLHQGLSQVDRILASLGINIGPQVRAIGEMANVSGKTASQLGLVATAGLAVSAAFAGWQIGRLIADWLGLDEAIGKAASSLFGFGNDAAEIAGHKMDIMARATKIAGHEITNYDQALKIIKESNDHFAESMNTSAHRVSLWTSEIAKVKSQGKLNELTADLDAQNGTLKQFSKEYGVSVEALQFFQRETKAATEVTKKQDDALKKQKEEMERLTKAQQAHLFTIGDKLFGTDAIKRATDYAEAIGRVENVSNLSIEAQEELAEAMKKGVEALIAAGRGTDDLTSLFESMRLEAGRTGREAAEAMKRIEDSLDGVIRKALIAQQAIAIPGLSITSGASGLGATGTVTFDDKGNMVTGGGSQFVPGSGVTVFSGAPSGAAAATGAMVHPSLTPGIGRPLGTVNMTNHINVVDTQDNLARSIGAQITRSVMQGTKFS